MNKKKRRVAVLLSATIGSAVLVLSGCSGKSDQTEKTLRVGVITYSQDDPFINGLTDELKVQLKAMENKQRRIIVSTKSGNDDQQEQNEKVEEMIDAGCDVLCINLVDRTAPSRIIRMARNEDIPVIFFNREPVEEDMNRWEKLYYVGADAKESAVLEGKILVDAYRKDPASLDRNGDGTVSYVLLEGESNHQDSLIRTEWSIQTLKDGGVPLEKITGGIASWERSQASAMMEQWLTDYPDQIELVICNNDDMALGAIDAIERAGILPGTIKLAGIDATPPGVEALKAGKLFGTVEADKEGYANAIFGIAASLSRGLPIDESIKLENGKYFWCSQKGLTQADIAGTDNK